MNMSRFSLKPLALAGALGLLTACGGGGGGGSSARTGVFLDAEVAGVSYEALPSGLTGITNAKGEFRFETGDTVTFSVGNIVLGSAPADGILTPLSLAANATDLPDGVSVIDVALNIAIFLQTFDSDGDPDNGITISNNVRQGAQSLVLDFAQDSEDFVSDNTLSGLAAGQGVEVVAVEAAGQHVERTQARLLLGSWKIENDTGSDFAVVSFFPDGTYVLGIDHTDPNCDPGVERGKYTLNPFTRQLTVSDLDVDNTGPGGDCGFYEHNASEEIFLSFTNASRIELTANPGTDDAGTLTLTKIANSGRTGSWAELDKEGDVVAVATLLGDGTYMVAQVEDDDTGVEVGLETGRWSVNNDGLLSATPALDRDTNGTGGLSELEPGLALIPDGFGRLLVVVPGDDVQTLIPIPYELKLQGNEAYSEITFSLCPGTPGGWDYSFGASSMTLTGTASWSSCQLGSSETLTVPYTRKDSPFACGGPVCDYFDLNREVTGIDEDGRPYRASYAHAPDSKRITYTKTITGGPDEGQSWTEVVYLGQAVR